MLSEYIHIMFSFPTVIFSGPLILAGLYWLFVIIGVADAEIFDAAFEGASEAAGEALAEGVAEAAVEGAADGTDISATQAFGFSALLLIGKVPVTISFSLLFFWNWLICLFGSEAMLHLSGDAIPAWIWQTLLLAISLVASLFLTNMSARPLAPLFKTHVAVSKQSLVGEVVEITTGRVDREFGQAAYEDGGAGMTLQVRCDPEAGLTKGDKAVLLSHDPETDSFEVESIEDMVASDLENDEPTTKDAPSE